MKLIDIIIIAVIVLVLGGAAAVIFRAKKQGKKCIGCPNSDSCSCNCGKSH
ncbi:MAG: FeoB-associated Cys-rich membrane protein [Oscillospiraceae bacterium]|nr:FeoB-associated Cys-rich membrane protein [Oscillospiraceae bacterium]